MRERAVFRELSDTVTNGEASLADAIRRTLILASKQQGSVGQDPLIDCVFRVRDAYGSDYDFSDDCVIADLVKSIAIFNFPDPTLEPAIERWVPAVSKALLADPASKQHLRQLWEGSLERGQS